jgi:uncharacterized protein YjaZ
MSFSLHAASPNPEHWERLEPLLKTYEADVRKVLPELTPAIEIYLDDSLIIEGEATGGFAYSPSIISFGFDEQYGDEQAVAESVKATLYHEGFHLVQGHTAHDRFAPYATVLDAAIYEGAATVFERLYTSATPRWGEYQLHTEEELESWKDAMSQIPIEQYWDTETGLWQKWAFYDPEDSQRWKLYKVGSWLVQRYIERSGKSIVNLRSMAASEIITTTA